MLSLDYFRFRFFISYESVGTHMLATRPDVIFFSLLI